MKKPLTTSTRLGRVLTSMRRARNQLERLLKSSNNLRDAAHVDLWRLERVLHDQACAVACRLRDVIDDEHDIASTSKSKQRAA